jgi:hypothetical protein
VKIGSGERKNTNIVRKISLPPMVQLSLMVEPAVGKYLKHTHPGDMYMVNVRHPLGSWIVNSLARKNTIQRVEVDTARFERYAAHLTHEFKFQMPNWYLEKMGTYIPLLNNFYFNQFVLNIMYAELMMNIVYRHGFIAQDQIQECIELFRNKYDLFEKEFPDERLRKKYLRLRKRYDTSQAFAEVFNPGELLWRI